ncbi:RNA polymerase sigma-70 factor [Bacteroides sp.]|uniref:RNA polymerase sigma-70 factor n=1 Tax=Bacteroides sp. TaxID=29523 RepID=UPI002585ED50|nr:RNA polymerase sigma-70 factor [Bacteroides sp.]
MHVSFDKNGNIVNALRSNSHKCFQEVFDYYYAPLCAFSCRYVRVDEAEEIVQDTMLWIWENRSSLVPELNIKSLLFTIVKNKSLDRTRHEKVKRKVLENISRKYDEEFSSPDFYIYNELLEKYHDTLNKIPQEYREAFLLNRNKGLTHRQIAEKLGISTQLVNYRICKALDILRVELKEYLPLFLLLYQLGIIKE